MNTQSYNELEKKLQELGEKANKGSNPYESYLALKETAEEKGFTIQLTDKKEWKTPSNVKEMAYTDMFAEYYKNNQKQALFTAINHHNGEVKTFREENIYDPNWQNDGKAYISNKGLSSDIDTIKQDLAFAIARVNNQTRVVKSNAEKAITDSNYLYTLNVAERDRLIDFVKNTPNLQGKPLTSQDYLAISDAFARESQRENKILETGMNSNQLSEKASEYYNLYQEKEKQELKEQSLKTYEIEKNGTIQGEVKAENKEEAFIKVSERYGEENFRLIEKEPEIKLYENDWVILNEKDEFVKFNDGQIMIYGDEEEAEADKIKGDKVVNVLDLDDEKQTELKENIAEFREITEKNVPNREWVEEELAKLSVLEEKHINNPNNKIEPIKDLFKETLDLIKNKIFPKEKPPRRNIEEFYASQNYDKITPQQLDNFIDKAIQVSSKTYRYMNELNDLLNQDEKENITLQNREEPFNAEEKKQLLTIINNDNRKIEVFNNLNDNLTQDFDSINKKQQKMETLTPQEKVQELFNEIKETFSPIEKAFFQRKLENTSPAGGWQLGNFLDHSGITPQEQEKVNSFFAEKVSPIFQKENDNIHRELYNKTELDNDFIKEVNPIFLDVDIKREKEMEQPQKNMEKQQEQTQPQQEKKFDVAEYLNNQMKYLGFGDNHKEAIQKGIDSKDNSFQIHTTSDKALFGNKAEFAVNFNKSEKGGVFLNSFDAKLTTNKGEERSQNFRLNFTAKEAINLLEGRAVKTELQNKQGEKFNAFVKLNFAEEKNEFGNYKSKLFNENYGVDTGKIVDELKLKFDKPEYRENAIKALEKGNIIKAKFEHEGKEIQGKAFLNVEYKTLNLYNDKMQRLNNNKPLQGLAQDNSHEKNNVREQSISRGI